VAPDARGLLPHAPPLISRRYFQYDAPRHTRYALWLPRCPARFARTHYSRRRLTQESMPAWRVLHYFSHAYRHRSPQRTSDMPDSRQPDYRDDLHQSRQKDIAPPPKIYLPS
jgi:hypothetical protein